MQKNIVGFFLFFFYISIEIFAINSKSITDTVKNNDAKLFEKYYFNVNSGIVFTKVFYKYVYPNNFQTQFKKGFTAEMGWSRYFKDKLELNICFNASFINTNITKKYNSNIVYIQDEKFHVVSIPTYISYHFNNVVLNPSIQMGISYSRFVYSYAQTEMNLSGTDLNIPRPDFNTEDLRNKNNLYYSFGIGINHIKSDNIFYIKLLYNFNLYNISKLSNDQRYQYLGSNLHMKSIIIQIGVSLPIY